MCPPGVDQTTRTTARWQILALETKHRQELEDNMTPYQFLAKRGSMDAFTRLYRFDRSHPAVGGIHPAFDTEQALNEGRLHRSPYSRLEKMPPELLSMITAYLVPLSPFPTQSFRDEDDENWGDEHDASTSEADLIALALSSRTLWYHVTDLVYSLCNPSEGIWAGKTLICTSTWLEDVPEGVHKVYPNMKGSCEQWHARLSQRRGLARGYGPGMNPVRSWNWDAYSCWKWPGSDLPENRLREAFHKHAKLELQGGFKTSAVLDQLENVFEKLLNPTQSLWESGEKQSWMLRNLDTKECVRLEFVDQFDQKTDDFLIPQHRGTQQVDDEDDSAYMSGESSVSEDDLKDDDGQKKIQSRGSPVSNILAVAGLPWLTADFILMSRIGWSNPRDYHEEVQHVHRGPWAGNRFVITKAVDGDTDCGYAKDEKEWTDVTRMIIGEAEKLRELINRDGHIRR